MKIQEGSQKVGLFRKQYAISISMVVESDTDFDSEFAEAKVGILDWVKERGDKAKEIWFIIVTDRPLVEMVKSKCVKIFADDDIYTVFATRHPIEVEILNEDGETEHQFAMSSLYSK